MDSNSPNCGAPAGSFPSAAQCSAVPLLTPNPTYVWAGNTTDCIVKYDLSTLPSTINIYNGALPAPAGTTPGQTQLINNVLNVWDGTSWKPVGSDDSIDLTFDVGSMVAGVYPDYGSSTVTEKNYRFAFGPQFTMAKVTKITMELHDTATSAISIDVKKNGATFQNIAIAVGGTSFVAIIAQTFITGDELSFEVVTGDATVGGTIQVFNTNF